MMGHPVIRLIRVVDSFPRLKNRSSGQGWRLEFADGGLNLPTRGLKHGFQGTINTKNLRKNRFSLSDGRLACSDWGAIAP